MRRGQRRDTRHEADRDTASTAPERSTIYPRRYFDLSPVWFEWNRLTAADVHALHAEPGFEGQNIYFHLNHPIRFVRIVGVVVDVECFVAGKYVVIHLDDGSGACIGLKTTRLEKPNLPRDKTALHEGVDRFVDETTVEHVTAHVQMGIPSVYVKGRSIDIGTVLRAKGTISMFRQTKQLDLKLLAVVKDTNEEAASWRDTAQWKRDRLTKPWILSESAMRDFDAKSLQDQIASRTRMQKNKELAQKLQDRQRRHEARREKERCAEEQTMNAGALPGSEITREPWD